MILILIFFVLLLCTLYVFCIFIQNQRKLKRFPQPPSYPGWIPLIGHAYMFIGDSVQIWKSLRKIGEECLRRGGIITLSLGSETLYVISDPQDYLTIGNTCLEKDQRYELFKPWLGDGLITGSLDIWKKHRKLLNPAFNQAVLDGFLKTFNSQSRELVKELASKADFVPFDHYNYLEKMTLETVCLTAIGIPEKEIVSWKNQYMKAATKLVRIQMYKLVKIWLQVPLFYYLSGLKKEEEHLITTVHHCMDLIIKAKRDAKNKATLADDNVDSGTKFKAFLDVLLENSESLSDQEIKEEVDSLIVAGYQSIASTLTIILVTIGSCKKMQSRLHQELQEVYGDSERDVKKSDFSKLAYLDAVIKETLRFFSVTPVVSRHLHRNIKLKNYTLLRGRGCAIMAYSLHRHSSWGPDAYEFKPERWLGSNKRSNGNKIFIPFSFGKRDCIGQTYALMLMKIALVHVLRRFRIEGDRSKLELQINVILKPANGHHISVYDRENPMSQLQYDKSVHDKVVKKC